MAVEAAVGAEEARQRLVDRADGLVEGGWWVGQQGGILPAAMDGGARQRREGSRASRPRDPSRGNCLPLESETTLGSMLCCQLAKALQYYVSKLLK